MNRTIRNLIVAAPLAFAGITMAPGAAMADGMDIAIPKPKPEPPKDIADAPKPPKPPKGPQDLADAPKPQDPAPKPQAPNGGTESSTPGVEDTKAEKKAAKVVSAKGSPDSIDRSDNLFVAGPAEVELAADTDNGGMDLTWLLVGGGVVTASGIAFAARKRANA